MICLKFGTGNGLTDMASKLFVLNPGSSTLKFTLYEEVVHPVNPQENLQLVASGMVDRLGSAEAALTLDVKGKTAVKKSVPAESPESVIKTILDALRAEISNDGIPENLIRAVGCRVVHGGDHFIHPTLVTQDVLDTIRAYAPLAPLHNPLAADVITAIMALLPGVPTVAVFDTAFHHTLPPVARNYALPYELCEAHHLYRFGFHGIAHQYVSSRLTECIGRVGIASKCITCHLGSGASICAVKNVLSIDTSMGLTPLEGLAMATRSGDVDPGVLLYLLREKGMTALELDDMLNFKSGMLGIYGLSGDVRDLETASERGDARAELALEIFAYRAAKTIGAYAVVLEGLHAIAFSGGIGEHSNSMRHRICRRLAFLGIDLLEQPEVSVSSPFRISTGNSKVEVWVIYADENHQIAGEMTDLLK